MSRIAFIGLGNMGGPMAGNLLQAGHEVTVFDLVPEAVATLTDAGAKSADSAVAAAAGAEVVITMLPAGHHVRSVYMDGGGLLDNVSDDTLLVDCSTIAAEDARAVAEAARERGIAFVDAPVSGGVAGAKAGTLTFICGGDAQAVENARPVLEVMGKAVFHAGPSGAGQVGKMCNNMLLAVLMIGTSEALNLAEAHGLDPAVLSEVMKASSGSNWALQVYNPYPGVMEGAPASNGYRPGFMVDLMAKDLGLAMNMATATGTATPLGSVARNLYTTHSTHGNGQRDFSSILQFLKGGDFE
ncbi:3-hydroxyisobutyrate dehydrogenase [Arhodomonas sp. AD133]|uniref:3-hydroxyisobutyrate dehydrogenase n=1 Tax=Arhodomonas sp. AD133 TaxID=3415009 RepID=UPI003EBFCCA5